MGNKRGIQAHVSLLTQGWWIWHRPFGSTPPCWTIRPSSWKPGRKHRMSQTDPRSTQDIRVEHQMVQNVLKNSTWNAAAVSLMTCGTMGNCNSTEMSPGPSFTQLSEEWYRRGCAYSAHRSRHDSGEVSK